MNGSTCHPRARSARRTALAACLLALLAAPGCVGYRLGSTLPADVKTIHVPTVINETGEPDVEIEVTRAIIEELQKDGSLRVAPDDQADLVLRVHVTRIVTDTIRYQRDRATSGEEYRMTLHADMTVLRSADQTVFAERTGVPGDTTFLLTGDLRSARRGALPNASRDLARRVVQAIVEHW